MTFIKEAPAHQAAWMDLICKLENAQKLVAKTAALAYLGILAALRLESGIPFHVKKAKELGTTRNEIISAILLGLPAAGNIVIQSLPIALAAYDSE